MAMWLSLIWTAVLTADLIIWALFRRFYRLHILGYRLSLLRRPLIVETKPGHYVGPPNEVPERVRRMLTIGAHDAEGFSPSSSVRMAVGFVILLQNSLAIGTVGKEGAMEEVCRRSGQLAFANTIPLVLLAFPDTAVGRVVRGCKPEMVWVHHLFGWLVWLNTMVHVGSSNAIAPGAAGMIFSVFGIGGVVFLYMSLLSKIKVNSSCGAPNAETCKRRFFTGHGVLGAAFLFAVLVHSPTGTSLVVASISCAFAVVGMLSQNPRVISVKLEEEREKRSSWAVGCRLDNLSIEDGQACYFEVNGKPARMAWTNKLSPGIATSPFVTLFAGVNSGERAAIKGPFIGFDSPYVYAPEGLIIYIPDSEDSFSAAHTLLHARKARSKTSVTYIMCVGPKQGFFERFDSEHDCAYRECIKEVHDAVVGSGQAHTKSEPRIARIVHRPAVLEHRSFTGIIDEIKNAEEGVGDVRLSMDAERRVDLGGGGSNSTASFKVPHDRDCSVVDRY